MDEGVLAAARVIRPFLPGLVGPAAGDLDGRIAALLDRAGQGEDTTAELAAVLHADPAAGLFTDAVIRDAPLYRPPAQQPRHLRVFSPAPGPPQRITAPEYQCPEPGCDARWFQLSARMQAPECETHHVQLVPAR
jgi:hypothetical protein